MFLSWSLEDEGVRGRKERREEGEGDIVRKVVHLIFFSISASVRVSRKGLQMSASLWFLGVQVVVSGVTVVTDDDDGR